MTLWNVDLHSHTKWSKDCLTEFEEIIKLAPKRGIDRIAITDHNTITQLADIAAQQRNFPKTLLIPGTEITTFLGHANVIGNTSVLDFQLGSSHLPTLAKLFDEAAAQDAFVSINHPGMPSGEICRSKSIDRKCLKKPS